MLEENCTELENEQKKLLEENRDLETRYVTASFILNGGGGNGWGENGKKMT